MAYSVCRSLHKRLYKDAYETKSPKIIVDHITYSLIYLGFKYCNNCEMASSQEKNKHCKCCGSTMKISEKNIISRRKRYLHKIKCYDEDEDDNEGIVLFKSSERKSFINYI